MGRAKDLIYAQLKEKRKKPARVYKPEEVFDPAFLETKPEGVRHGFIDEQEALWTSLPEQEIYNGLKPTTSEMLIHSGHHAVVGSFKPMRGTGHLNQSEQYPGTTDEVMNEARCQGNFSHHRLVNSLAWHQLNELRGMKVIIISDSTIDPTVNFPYFQNDVAVVAKLQSTLQQHAALMASITQTIEQATPVVIILGFMDHLDLEGHLKKLLSPNVTIQDIHDAIRSAYVG